jgi:hypothetical protein
LVSVANPRHHPRPRGRFPLSNVDLLREKGGEDLPIGLFPKAERLYDDSTLSDAPAQEV